jgi:hypothetical protein
LCQIAVIGLRVLLGKRDELDDDLVISRYSQRGGDHLCRYQKAG